ncbi:thymine dioxygenase [Lyophyllum atratum]|nr:thymine dioxygenase [Lyophyllum atratum]
MTSPHSESEVQVVDFAPFLNGSGKKSVAAAILASFKTTGFVYLTNHGFPDDKLQDMFSWSKKFFSLPRETKMLAPHPESGTHHRGYSPPGLEKVAQHLYDTTELIENRAKAQDVKESFESGREEDEVMPNIWLPDGILPGFKEASLDFFWNSFELQKTILEALAVGFDLPEDYFVKFHTKPDNQLRLLWYPSVPLKALEKNEITRIDGHSDAGSITILFQDDVGGLEVEDPNSPGSFTPVPPIPGSIVVNAGDFLMRWSNDTIRSTVHRVRAPPSAAAADGMVPERYSIPYFCCPDFATVVEAIPGTWSAERPKRYEPISAAEYVMKRLAANY